MKRKIFWAMCIIAIVSIILTSVCISVLSYNEFRRNMEKDVQSQTTLAKAALDTYGEEYLPTLNRDEKVNRMTLIDEAGNVLYDSEADAATLANHGDREEVQAALVDGSGSATRLSSTMGKETYYHAEKLENGNIIRVASTMDSVYAIIFSMLPWMIALIIVVFIFSLFISRWATQRILAPINELDLENPTENDVYEELSPLLLKIHHQNDEIKQRVSEAGRKQKEFLAITENMSEGLIVLNSSSHILAVNQSAKDLLKVEEKNYEHKHILEMNRNLTLEKVANTALHGESAEETIKENGHFYIIHGNPVTQGGRVRGAILLIFDITERQKTEKIRREFSANVSHELKTPLTAISGYAELMENGLVKAEDTREFSHRIHSEARHLLELIDDIMELSRLDEKDDDYLWETLSLKEKAKDVGNRLEHLVLANGITLTITGDEGNIQGVPRLIDELLYNLMDNAIKYSEKDTTVNVAIKDDGSQVLLTVTDQGIGIPEKYRDRVFERFFRVDKSHSKSISGTGLGLAIVKHVVTYHNGTIQLQSQPGNGTKITVIFPG